MVKQQPPVYVVTFLILADIKLMLLEILDLAFSEIVLDVKEDEFVSLEVSSFQLDLIEKFQPAAALILNITPDHLNRYENSLENMRNQSTEYTITKMKKIF